MDESAIIDDLVLWLIETYDVAEVSVDGNDAEGVVLRVSIKAPSAAARDPLPPSLASSRGPVSGTKNE
jgi:hypothetical protein